MEINNITVPDPSTTFEYITDVVGGTIYEVATIVVVNQKPIDYFNTQLVHAQNTVQELQSKKSAVDSAVAEQSDLTPVEIVPIEPVLEDME